MFGKYKLVLVALLVISQSLDIHAGTQSVSWIYRGTAQQNNTVLAFNYGDTLNLACRGLSDTTAATSYFSFIISKGSKPPSAATPSGTGPTFQISYTDGGTIIYNDLQGVTAGYENFVIIRFQNTATNSAGVEYLRLGVGFLRLEDAGTYHCSAGYTTGSSSLYSGGLTINVFTKQGQAHSSRANANKLLAYSTMMLGASKLLF